MKKVCVIIVCSLVLFVGSVSARCIGPVVNGKCMGTIVPGTDGGGGGYQGVGGTTYQYDQNNPLDWNKYYLDRDAQRRDQMNTDPRVNSDREQGQYGGGIYGR